MRFDPLIEAAAAPTLARICRDRERATHRPIRRFLEYLEQHLLVPDLSIRRIVQAGGKAMSEERVREAFRQATKRTPTTYAKECRLEVGARLLRKTQLSVEQIAGALGYSTRAYFASAFSAWSGYTPTRYREAKTADRLFAAAAAPTLARIRRDHERASQPVKAILVYLRRRLFDSSLTTSQLLRASGFPGGKAPAAVNAFRDVVSVSLTPYAYIEDCRLEVAGVLLWASDLTVTAIAIRVGYARCGSFSAAFERWSGLRPTVFRPSKLPPTTWEPSS